MEIINNIDAKNTDKEHDETYVDHYDHSDDIKMDKKIYSTSSNNEYSNIKYKGANYDLDFKIPATTSTALCTVVGIGIGAAIGIYIYNKYIKK